MEFKTPQLAQQVELVHPNVVGVMLDFEGFSKRQGLRGPLLTECVRDMKEQVLIYVDFWEGIFWNSLNAVPLEDEQLKGARWLMTRLGQSYWHSLLGALLRGKVDPAEVLRAKGRLPELRHVLTPIARAKFTWHWVRCAVDMRTTGGAAPRYSKMQLQRVDGWFKQRCKGSDWEYLLHDVHGPHLHLGFKDKKWRAQFDPLTQGGSNV